jgi:DNA-binding beta-propeller fold protein YncE
MKFAHPAFRALVATAAVASLFIGARPRPVPLTVYSSPAGTRIAGTSPQRPTAAILPDGRVTAPVGKTIFVGTNPQGIALSPDGSLAVIADAEAPRDVAPIAQTNGLVAGYALVVVDTATMRVDDVYHDPTDTFSGGVAVVTDPHNTAQMLVLASDAQHDALRVFDLSRGGSLTPEAPIALPLASAPGYAHDHRAGPTAIAVSQDGRTAYVAETAGDAVAAVDLASRTVLGGAAVGFDPTGLVASGDRVYVDDAGLSEYRVLSPPARAPRFALPDVGYDRASSLAVLPLVVGGGVSAQNGAATFVRMDPAPDGTSNVGGIVQSAIVARKDGRFAYVALSNVDRVAVVDLNGAPRVTAGLDLRLFPEAPYGTQPSAEALAADDSRLYVALGGLNAVAVLDARKPERLHRLGLIPTGWYPAALALSHDGRFLYVADAKGVGGWGLLQRVDLKRLPLGPVTLSALRYNRSAAYAKPNALIPPLRSLRRSNAIRHVIYISEGIDDYDSVLGDLTDASGRPRGNGVPSYELYPQSVTPNLHALAAEFALADNLYAGSDAASTLQLATAGTVSLPVERESDDPADPQAYPRAGFLFNALARAHESFRDYGALLQVSGYDDGLYSLDVPVLNALDGSVDLAYAAWNSHVSDAQRAAEFVRDFDALSQEDRVPDFTYVWIPTPPGGQGAADAALGRVVDAITHSAQWSSTAIFIVPDSFELRRDHVDGARIYAIVVSPYARRGFVDDDHLSIPSVVKTEEEILGLPPLAIDDLLATDLAPCFGAAPDAQPYTAR